MKPVIFHRKAEDELREATARYEQQREGLGEEFASEVEQRVALISRLPRSFPAYGTDGYRSSPLSRFPYTIYYLEQDDRIWIAAVAHQKRRPGYWEDRQPEPNNGTENT